MLKRRDFVWSLLLSTAWILLLLAATDAKAVLRLRGYLAQFRSLDSEDWIPLVPFARAVGLIILFYVVLGLVLGAIAHAVARILASERNAEDKWIVPRGRYYGTFLPVLFLSTAYFHAHAMLIYPGLYSSSWRWAALAGSPLFVTLFGLLGVLAAAAVALLMIRKRQAELAGWLRRRWWIPLGAAVAAGGAWGAVHWGSRPEPVNRGPNVIILGIDSVRPDHVSGLGYFRPTTPNLDAFLRDATAFPNAFVPLARTGPSWVSILTGCYPTRHGHRDDLAPKEERIPPVATLAGHLRKLGYATSFFLDNSNFMAMDPEMGFSFISQPDPNVVWFGLSFFPLHLSLYYYFLNNPVGFHYAPMLRSNQAFSATYDWRPFAGDVDRQLDQLKGKEKFFLAAHTCIGHAPFTVRYPYSTYFSPKGPAPQNRFAFRWPFERILSEEEFARRTQGRDWPSLFSQEINLYDALMLETDDWLGAVLASIRRKGLYDNSLIVVLSDHGEDLWRKDHYYHYITSSHGFHVWGDDSYRIMMAVKLPQSRKNGQQVPWLVRSVDVAPTVLDALALPPLPAPDGLSLMPQIEDPRRDPGLDVYLECGLTLDDWFIPGHRRYPFDHWAFFQYVDPQTLRIYRKQEYMPGFVMAKDRVLRDDKWKLIAYPMRAPGPVAFKTTLHDVERDPTNLSDWSTSAPAALAAMRLRLKHYLDLDARAYGFEWRWMETPPTTATLRTAAPTP